MKKRILVVTPRSPFQARGADELERLSGIKWFIQHGFEVKVITKTMNSDLPFIDVAQKELGIPIIPIPYKFTQKSSGTSKIKRLLNPLYWDGASYEYFDSEIVTAVEHEMKHCKPDLVWFDFTYLWPLHSVVKRFGVPVVTRSLNYEPKHFFEEEGISLKNIILYVPKVMTEFFAARSSDYMLALNPNEEKKYSTLGAKQICTLPLQALPDMLGPHSTHTQKPLHVLFMGSSYTIQHNCDALEFVAGKVVPIVHKKYPSQFVFHITGAKFPKKYESYIDNKTVFYDGYIPKEDMKAFFDSIDIVISPSVKDVGMQGKVFEPIARSIPLITSKNNIVGYPFKHKESVLFAASPEEYADMLSYVSQDDIREGLSRESGKLSRTLFSREIIDTLLLKMLSDLKIHI